MLTVKQNIEDFNFRDYGRWNRSAQIVAITNGNVKVNADYTGNKKVL